MGPKKWKFARSNGVKSLKTCFNEKLKGRTKASKNKILPEVGIGIIKGNKTLENYKKWKKEIHG